MSIHQRVSATMITFILLDTPLFRYMVAVANLHFDLNLTVERTAYVLELASFLLTLPKYYTLCSMNASKQLHILHYSGTTIFCLHIIKHLSFIIHCNILARWQYCSIECLCLCIHPAL